jgi:hypothetical protein
VIAVGHRIVESLQELGLSLDERFARRHPR